MMNDDDDLDKMSPEQLRDLKQEVLLRIETVGSQSADLNPGGAEEIRKLDDLLREIEIRLSGFDAGAL
jgi:hypothetical protein